MQNNMKKITTAQIEEIIIALQDIKSRKSHNQIASEMGGEVSVATISNIINRKALDKVSDAMWAKLAKYTKTGEAFKWVIRETQNFKLITDTCRAAMEERSMKLIIGKTGLGKTTALERFARNNTSAYYVLLQKTMGVRDCLVAIAHAVGEPVDGTTNQLVKAVTKKLIERGGLLILDDAGKVIKKFYGVLQQIYDSTEGACGIVVAGVPDLKAHLEKNASRLKESYNELVSRFSFTQNLYDPTAEMICLICEHNGITDKQAQRYIANITRDYRDLRNIIGSINRLNPVTVTLDVVKELKVGGFYN
jgi:DNA transposition AAA+ family ATPase